MGDEMLAYLMILLVQEGPVGIDTKRAAVGDRRAGDVSEMAVALRVTGLGGQLDGEEDWGEFFDAGYGIDLKYEYLWKATKVVHAGLYGGLTFDYFQGEKADLSDSLGTLLVEHEDLTLLRLVVGGRIRESFGVFFMDQALGVGVAVYSDVDATITDDLGPFDVASIEGGAKFTWEFTARFGFYLSPKASVFMSFAAEQNAAPGIGSDLDDGTFDYEAQKNFVWTIGANLAF